MNRKALLDAIETALREVADEERRKHTAGYFPTKMEILGVAVPEIRKVARATSRKLREAPAEEVIALALELVPRGSHEGRQVAHELLSKRKDALERLDQRLLEKLGQGNDNWASVDSYSVSVAGPVWRMGGVTDKVVKEWARSPDVWWRRTALVSTVALNQKSRGGSGDVKRTLAICELLASDQEPMVAKALSWALRAVIPHDPDAVARFLMRHAEHLPALVIREVNNKLRTGRKNPGRAKR